MLLAVEVPAVDAGLVALVVLDTAPEKEEKAGGADEDVAGCGSGGSWVLPFSSTQ